MNNENNVIDLKKFRMVRKLNEPKKEAPSDPYQDPGERIKRIRASLERINELMKSANIHTPHNVQLSFRDE